MLTGALPLGVALTAFGAYAAAALPQKALGRGSAVALVVGWVLHLVLLVLDIGGFGEPAPGARLGFAPVISMTVWLVVAVHTIESRLVPLPAVRRWLALTGALSVLVATTFPGEARQYNTPLVPLHFALGVASYALFGAAVLHAIMLDAAERRLRLRRGGVGAVSVPPSGRGVPLLQLERLTFRFVEAGFIVLTCTLLLGALTTTNWRWDDHKIIFSLLGWLVFAGLLAGRYVRGWRGSRATRWLYAGAALLLLAYVGSRFVFEVLLGRAPPAL